MNDRFENKMNDQFENPETRPHGSKQVWFTPMEISQLSRILGEEIMRVKTIPSEKFNFLSEKVAWVTELQGILDRIRE